MKIALYFSLVAFASLTACSSAEKSESDGSTEEMTSDVPSLEMAWETDTTLITPESVIYDEKNNVYYVSCIGAVPPGAQDGDGYIAKVSAEGEILANHWVDGLDAPKGMAIVDGKLYVADVDKLVSIDIESGKLLSKTLVVGSAFLNDADASPDGTVYLTDTENGILFKADGDEISEAFKSDELKKGLNGVLLEQDKTLLVSYGSGKVYTLIGDELTAVADSISGGDGLKRYKDGHFVSGWGGEVYYLGNDWSKTKILDTKADKVNAADFELVEKENLLLVPTFFANKLVAYRIK